MFSGAMVKTEIIKFIPVQNQKWIIFTKYLVSYILLQFYEKYINSMGSVTFFHKTIIKYDCPLANILRILFLYMYTTLLLHAQLIQLNQYIKFKKKLTIH